MQTFLKWILRIAFIFALLFAGLFWLVFFSSRPANMTDPTILAGDGSQIDYCARPVLDGSGKMAVDIPKANTPGCSYDHFPLPILGECREPLAEGVDDLRGLWRAVNGKLDHVERVEQCGSRTVITAAGIIHDIGPNATGGLHSNDTEGGVSFIMGEREYCMRTSANIRWRGKKMEFKVLGWGPVVVRRYMDGAQLVWEYADGSVTRMERICDLPVEHKFPKPRGPRRKIF